MLSHSRQAGDRKHWATYDRAYIDLIDFFVHFPDEETSLTLTDKKEAFSFRSTFYRLKNALGRAIQAGEAENDLRLLTYYDTALKIRIFTDDNSLQGPHSVQLKLHLDKVPAQIAKTIGKRVREAQEAEAREALAEWEAQEAAKSDKTVASVGDTY